MKHRHLTHETFTLAAIDDILDRGALCDWAPLLREVRRHPTGATAQRVSHILRHHRMYGTTNAWSRFLKRQQGRSG